MQLRNGHCQQAAGYIGQVRGRRPVGGKVVGAVGFLPGLPGSQPIGQGQHVAGRWALTHAHAVALVHDGSPGRAGQRQQAAFVLAQGRHEFFVAGHAAQQLDQYRATRDAFFNRERALLQCNLQRQDLAHELAGGTHVVGQAAWLHGVAGHQAP